VLNPGYGGGGHANGHRSLGHHSKPQHSPYPTDNSSKIILHV
jgi:hypothetical protein